MERVAHQKSLLPYNTHLKDHPGTQPHQTWTRAEPQRPDRKVVPIPAALWSTAWHGRGGGGSANLPLFV